MNIGGMGTIAALKKEKKRLRDDKKQPISQKMSRKTQNENQKLEELRNSTKELAKSKLSFTNYPSIGWGMGILMVISGLYLVYHISLGKYGSLFSEFRQGFWWQYLVSSLILFLGVLFLCFLKSERVTINKRTDVIQVIKKNFFCKSKSKTRKVSNLISAEIVKRGSKDFANRTIHYKMVLFFNEEKPLEILESSNKFAIKQKYVKLKTFLNFSVELEDIQIMDESDQTLGSRV